MRPDARGQVSEPCTVELRSGRRAREPPGAAEEVEAVPAELGHDDLVDPWSSARARAVEAEHRARLASGKRDWAWEVREIVDPWATGPLAVATVSFPVIGLTTKTLLAARANLDVAPDKWTACHVVESLDLEHVRTTSRRRPGLSTVVDVDGEADLL